MSEYIQGPWVIVVKDDGSLVIEAEKGASCVISLAGWYGERGDGPANAHLITAAPEMYKAIETALRHHDESCLGQDTWEILRTSLAKARRG